MSAPTLPITPLEHVSMDYERLRKEALELVARLSGEQWTDHNASDPGVTILEQLCYALTDVAYRIGFPIADLVAGQGPGLPGPGAILTSDPVTLDDLRKLALDVPDVVNAWVAPQDAPELAFFHHAGSKDLRLRADPAEPDAVPVEERGVYRVIVQTTERVTAATAIEAVAARLHAHRPLTSDLELSILEPLPIGVTAELEIDPVDDPVALLAEVILRIEDQLAPRPTFTTRASAVSRGRRTDEVFEGPLLDRGYVEALPSLPRAVRTSDLLHAVRDVNGVRAVRSMTLLGPTGPERWSVDVPVGSVATLAPLREPQVQAPPGPGDARRETTLLLVLGDSRLELDPAVVRRRVDALRLASSASASLEQDEPGPRGRTRDLTRYRSVLHQLPEVYGVGAFGLPAAASPARRAQALQLQAYLLLFDQLLANSLAQLAHAAELLSPEDEGTATYFAQPIIDPRLPIDTVVVQEPAAHRAWLDGAVEVGAPLERRGRFLAHLLARFSEELGEHLLVRAGAEGGGEGIESGLVAARRAFLRAYPWLSRTRGSGCDLERIGVPGIGGGFEERLRHKLGTRLHVVEHVLLRPVQEDALQLADEGDAEVPLLADVASPDPWSHQLSVVLDDRKPAGSAFEEFVRRTVQEETPAHLTVSILWLGDADGLDDWSVFERAWSAFGAALREYRGARSKGSAVPPLVQLRFRDARDRVVDLLGLGRSYPLRDVPVRPSWVVPPGERARIVLEFSQQGVVYELRDAATGGSILHEGTPIAVNGKGDPVELVTPPIQDNVSYRILAAKPEPAGSPQPAREAYLRTRVAVAEGVDTSLVAQIRALPLLDRAIDPPSPTDARLGPCGVKAEIEVLLSQEGVTYEIIQHTALPGDASTHVVLSEKPVIGNSGTIVLRTVAMHEDVDLQVRASKDVGAPSQPSLRMGVLQLVLPLRVRANPATTAELAPAIAAHGGNATLRLAPTQRSTQYRVHRARIRDRQFVIRPGVPTVDVTVADENRTIRVERPRRAEVWEDLPGFAPAGDAVPGNGGALELPVGPATADTMLLVEATKLHASGRLGSDSPTIASSVPLDQALAFLVRPDPSVPLRVEATLSAGATTGTLLLDGGQPGVFYELTADGSSVPVGRPGYFHQRDDTSPALNKGIGELVVEVDAVVARGPAVAGADPASTPPLLPTLDTASLPAGTSLSVLARRATTLLTAALDRRAVLEAVPTVTAQPTSVTPGGAAMIVVAESRADERYALWVKDGAQVGAAVPGTGGALELPTGPLQRRTVFCVAITRLDPARLAVERRVEIAVEVG